MPPTEEATPPDAPKHDDTAAEGWADAPPSSAAPNSDDTLSPAVRRLVRQFDLDITGIHGTGPSGRIRVGDVVALLGGRTDTGKRDAPARAAATEADESPAVDDASFEPAAAPAEAQAIGEPEKTATATEPPAAAEPAARTAIPTTTVFDCDISRVVAHRRKLRRDSVEVLTTSYVLTALAAALDEAPELTAGETARFGVSLTTADGRVRTSVLGVPDTLPESLDERVRAVDIALRANLHTPLEHSNLLVHHYGESGSLLATPTPIGAGHVASVGIGRLRREVVVRVVDGAESPRIATCCHVSLSFYLDRVPLQGANRALATAVAILESWPE
jgi:pyruvate/2-oxoglutarate dehydrogenase complex dihydrolipoamide acyltransferase (E2) component